MKTTPDSSLIIGLDLGDRRHTVCVLDHAGEIRAETTIPNTREQLEGLSRQYPGATIAMETGSHSPWISRLFEARSHRVYVAKTRKVRAISQSQTKTDKAPFGSRLNF